MQIGAGQTVVVGDNGDLVFNQIKTGNGTFNVTPASRQHRHGPPRRDHRDRSSRLHRRQYSIEFTAPNAYQVVDSTGGGGHLRHLHERAGHLVRRRAGHATGQPATGDSFQVAPSTNQSVFTTVQNLVNALQPSTSSAAGQAQLNNSIVSAINGIDQALDQAQTVQARVGARLNTITTRRRSRRLSRLSCRNRSPSCRASIIRVPMTSLESQNTTLSAAMQAYTQTQGLSLFKYL